MSGLKPLLDPITTSSTNSSNSTRRDNSKNPIQTHVKKILLYILLMTMVILITTFTLLFSRIVSLTTASTPSLDIPQHEQGVITQLCLNHTLQYNEEARKASKKLYELLYDFDNAIYDDENMVLGSKKMYPNTYSKQPYVANGYIGSRIPNIGFGYALDTINLMTNSGAEIPGALNNGWPLRNHRFAGAFVSDFYCLEEKLNSTNFPELDDNGYSTVISTIPQWTNLQFSLSNNSVWFNPQEVALDDVTNYNQNMSMRNGVVTTQMDWLDGMINVKSEVMTHKKIYPLGMMSLTISLNLDNLPSEVPSIDLNIYDILDFNTSHRAVLQDLGYDDANEGIFMIVEPNNVPYSNAAVYSTCTIKGPTNLNFNNFTFSEDFSTADQIAQMSSVVLSRDFPSVTIHKYVGVMSTEFNSNAELDVSNIDVAKTIATSSKGNFDTLMSTNAKAWAYIYNDAFIEIPSDALLEMTARSSLYHLLANTRTFNVSEERGLPVGVSGLSSDSYGGMVFWDSDIWMQPALLPFFPDIAKNMNNYRNATHNQARLNAQQYDYPGAVYPWTSGRYANCTSTGPCIDYEYHINVDVALASFSIYMNGASGIDEDYLRYTTWPMVRDAAEFFTAYVKYNATIDKYETYNLTDPDEFANHVNNGAFTNAGIKTLLKWATDIGNHLKDFVDPKWMDISKKIYIPRSPSNITLEYSGMNSSVEIKQADVALMIYPLGYITDESILNNAIKDLYYYSERQSASGPAMTYPVFVAAAAGMLNHGSSSQSYLYKSVLPYLRPPFAQFSEQSDDNFLTNGLTQPAFPFLTANGGFLQSILFGLTGLRYSYEVDPSTKKIFRLLKFSPVELPLLPGGIAIRNFKYMNQVLDIIIDDYNGTIVHKSGNASIRIKVPDRSLIRDRDISIYNGTNATDYPQFSNDYSEEGAGDRPVSSYGTYYTVNPGEELVLPLFKPALNVEGNIVESKQITNLTVGVPGDVSFSALDGNNYTHWQPAYKYSPAKLLIDLGEDNLHEIKNGLILWGERPAKNISISILPHTYAIEQFLANLTDVLEYSDVVSEEGTISEALEDAGVSTSFGENGACDEDITAILDWKTENLEGILNQIQQSNLLNKHFVRILDNYPVQPSEPYFREVYNKSMIEILPSNKTEFTIDYNLIDFNSTGCSFMPDMKNTTEWRKTRFILLSVEGSYDDDIDVKGGTIKEIVLRS